jgi:hypothetical protein
LAKTLSVFNNAVEAGIMGPQNARRLPSRAG